MAENFVAQELAVSFEEELYCWQEKKSEVEFLRDQEGEVVPIEVKAGKSVRSKSLHVFAEKYQPNHPIILSGLPLKKTPNDGIQHIPIYLVSNC